METDSDYEAYLAYKTKEAMQGWFSLRLSEAIVPRLYYQLTGFAQNECYAVGLLSDE